MNLLGSPTEVILSAAQAVFGRACSFILACHAGAGLGCLISLLIFGGPGSLTLDALGILLIPWLSVGCALASLFTGWGLLVYPLCLAVMMAFIQMELSFKWLWFPVCLIALDIVSLTWRMGM